MSVSVSVVGVWGVSEIVRRVCGCVSECLGGREEYGVVSNDLGILSGICVCMETRFGYCDWRLSGNPVRVQ